MDTSTSLKVHVTIHGRRYGASLAHGAALILGGGRALATADYRDGRFTHLKPTPPDFIVQMPEEDLDVLDRLAQALRDAGADEQAQGAAG